MASAKLYTKDGTVGADIALNDAIFNVVNNMRLVHQVVKVLMSARRQGNHETKTRRFVSGGGIKPFKQKGTGRARQGSSREPHMRGGGVAFGPHKRSHREHAPVSVKRHALRCALSDRVRNDQLCILDGFSMDAPQTKPMADLFMALSPEGRKTLLVTAKNEPNIVTSARNLERLTVRTASDVNVLDVLDARRVIIIQDAIGALEDRLT